MMPFGQSSSAVVGILHGLANLAAHELGGVRIRFLAQHQIAEGAEEHEAAQLPVLLEAPLPLLGCRREHGIEVARIVGPERRGLLPCSTPVVGVVRFHARDRRRIRRVGCAPAR